MKKRTKKPKPRLVKKARTKVNLDLMASPAPYRGGKKQSSSLVPHSSKWECFECGKVIGKKRICNYCGYDRGND